MNLTLLEAIMGRFLMIYGVILLIPITVAFNYNDSSNTILSFALTSLLTVSIGIILYIKGRIDSQMGVREGFVVVAGIWILASVIGAIPFYASGSVTNFFDALFETTSGFTTTGASVISNLEILPQSILFWRSLTHWLGGLGIIVLFIILLPRFGMGAVHLFHTEVPGPMNQKAFPKIRDEARVLWLIYLGLTSLEVLLLKFAGMSLFDAVNHSFSTLATGGFSTRTASITDFNSLAIELIIVFFMVLAGMNFNLYIQAWRRGPSNVMLDLEFKVYILLLLGATSIIVITLIQQSGFTLGIALRQSLFQVVSITTTTGFVTADFDQWPGLAKAILFFLMFTGGSAGSTAGGLKLIRIILLVKMGWNGLKQSLHPRLITSIVIQEKTVDAPVLTGISRYFFLFIAIFIVSSLLLAATGLEPFDAMSASIATLGNVGPGFGVVGPVANYASINAFGKVVLSTCMLLGRLELFALLVFLQSEFWRYSQRW